MQILKKKFDLYIKIPVFIIKKRKSHFELGNQQKDQLLD